MSYYTNAIPLKEHAKNIAYGVSGAGLTSYLYMGLCNPILGGLALIATLGVCGIKLLKDKYYHNSHSALNNYLAKSVAGDKCKINYIRLKGKGKTRVSLPEGLALPANVQSLVDQLANGRPQNENYTMIVEKLPNNKYKLKNQIYDSGVGGLRDCPEFELDQIIYQTPSPKTKQKKEEKKSTKKKIQEEVHRDWDGPVVPIGGALENLVD